MLSTMTEPRPIRAPAPMTELRTVAPSLTVAPSKRIAPSSTTPGSDGAAAPDDGPAAQDCIAVDRRSLKHDRLACPTWKCGTRRDSANEVGGSCDEIRGRT